MQTSDSITKIAGALAAFHKEMGVVKKTETNPFFKRTYASLPTILDAVKEPLEKADLVFVQFPENENELTTTLIHTESGEYMQSTYKMTPSKNDPQGQGSAITYQRRYALGAILGLNIAEDDDGNAASQPAKRAEPVSLYETVTKAISSAKTEEELTALLEKAQASTKLDEDDKAAIARLGKERGLILM